MHWLPRPPYCPSMVPRPASSQASAATKPSVHRTPFNSPVPRQRAWTSSSPTTSGSAARSCLASTSSSRWRRRLFDHEDECGLPRQSRSQSSGRPFVLSPRRLIRRSGSAMGVLRMAWSTRLSYLGSRRDGFRAGGEVDGGAGEDAGGRVAAGFARDFGWDGGDGGEGRAHCVAGFAAVFVDWHLGGLGRVACRCQPPSGLLPLVARPTSRPCRQGPAGKGGSVRT